MIGAPANNLIRMFLYLFPSYQSWWLFAAQFLLTCVTPNQLLILLTSVSDAGRSA
jgi:hypothetical protein